MADVKELFETFDADGSGRISTQEVAGLLAKLGAPKPAAAVAALVAQVDTDGDGEVSYAEFEAMLRSQADLAHIVQDKRQAIKQLHVRQGAGNSQHSFSSEEAEAFTEVLNSRLGGDAALASVLPLAQDAADPPLFAACADGVLLCKLVALIDGDAVDLRAVNMGALGRAADRKATFKVVENCNLAINAAKDVGCRVTNIGPRDIMTARPHLVLGRVEINQCVGCTRPFFTTSFLGDGAAVLAPSSGEEPASPRHRAGVASMAWRSTRRFSANAP